MAAEVLRSLGDVVYDKNRLALAENEKSFTTSLLRTIDISTINHQFRRIINGEAPLTDFNFLFKRPPSEKYSGIEIQFKVNTNSKPPSNIHILIGRNGVGKTTLLNSMIDALIPREEGIRETGFFANPIFPGIFTELPKDYFSGLVSVSFSAFDPFNPPNDKNEIDSEIRYCYVGLKKREQGQNDIDQWSLKGKSELCQDLISSLNLCLSLTAKKNRWINAVKKLESDLNFADMNLCHLVDRYEKDLSKENTEFSHYSSKLFNKMSSGHAIVLLTITKLIEKVEEKTLVLIDEPESHLHPPLLSAFTRALSDLLLNRNGVAIVATHSPVVLQEVPKSCVSIIDRTRLITKVYTPENETFAENVGTLTREVFRLEVSKSGFHDLLERSVSEGKSYDQINKEYSHQLGIEGKALLRSMLSDKDSKGA